MTLTFLSDGQVCKMTKKMIEKPYVIPFQFYYNINVPVLGLILFAFLLG